MSATSTILDRSLLQSRIVIDLFGPLIDISCLDEFKQVGGARYLSTSELAGRLPRKRLLGIPLTRITEEALLQRVFDALKNWRTHSGILDFAVLGQLLEATGHGTDVVIVSTVQEKRVFEAARDVVHEVITDYFEGTAEHLKFLRIDGVEIASWEQMLSRLSGESDRYTYVMHDHSWSQVGVTPRYFDEWVPSEAAPSKLPEIIASALRREQRRAPLPWLDLRNEIELDHYKALGNFVVFDERRLRNMRRKVETIRRWPKQRPVCVFLYGAPGTGKSFFVKEFRRTYPSASSGSLEEISLAKVQDIAAAVDSHIEAIRKGKAEFAFIDEVDTKVGDESASRFLMDPMTGVLRDDLGKEIAKLHSFVWFMAGSSGTTREDVIRTLIERDPKVRDFMSRIDAHIELPNISSPFEAMLQAAARIKTRMPNVIEIEKKALLFFAIAPWNDSRHIDNVAALVAADYSSSTLSLSMVEATLTDLDLQTALVAVERQELDGFMKIM